MAGTDLPASIADAPLLSQWVQVLADGGIRIFSGKVEIGQGIATALLRIACDQLGCGPGQVTLVAGDTALCPDEGWTSGSQSVEQGGAALRHACRRLRQACAALAARQLGLPVDDIVVQDGIFSPCRGRG